MNQKKGHRKNYVAPVELGSAVPAPTLAPQADASQVVRTGIFQIRPQRQRIPFPLLATAPLTEPTIPTILTRLQQIIPERQKHL